jgi:hypothetical protein
MLGYSPCSFRSQQLLALVGPMLSGYAVDAIGTEAGGCNFRKSFSTAFDAAIYLVS